jgi:hypothetical protein
MKLIKFINIKKHHFYSLSYFEYLGDYDNSFYYCYGFNFSYYYDFNNSY